MPSRVAGANRYSLDSSALARGTASPIKPIASAQIAIGPILDLRSNDSNLYLELFRSQA